MEGTIIKLKSFDVSVYARGDKGASKLAIVIPGRLDTKDYAHMTSHVDYLAQSGYYALSFDPPGTWESLGVIELYTITNTLQAIDELIEHFGNKPTLLLGHSRGGSNAMLAGVRNPHVTHFAAIMSHAGPTTIGLPKAGAAVSISTRDLPPGTSRTEERKEFALPASYFEDQAEYDVTDALASCSKPKLFIAGAQDDLVSVDSVRNTYDRASNPKMMKVVACEHDYRLYPNIIDEVNQILGHFLDKYPEVDL